MMLSKEALQNLKSAPHQAPTLQSYQAFYEGLKHSKGQHPPEKLRKVCPWLGLQLSQKLDMTGE